MTQKEIKELTDRAVLLEKRIRKDLPNVIWLMIVELIEIELELEAESNK